MSHHRPSCLGGRYGFSFTHFAIHSIPSVTPAPVKALHGRIIQSRDPIRFEQSWNACLISNRGRHPSISCLFPRIRSGAVSNAEDLKICVTVFLVLGQLVAVWPCVPWSGEPWTYPKTVSNARFDSTNLSGSAESIINITPWQSLKYLSQSDCNSSCPPKSQNISFTPCVTIFPIFSPTVVVIFDNCMPRYSRILALIYWHWIFGIKFLASSYWHKIFDIKFLA